MFAQLPTTSDALKNWTWEQLEPYFNDLQQRELTADTLEAWLADWTQIADLVDEVGAVLYIATTQDTASQEAKEAHTRFVEAILPQYLIVDQQMKEKLLRSRLKPEGYEIALRNLQAEADLYREENVPLISQQEKFGTTYTEITGAQTVEWEGKEIPIPQLAPVLEDPDRDRRERAWRLMYERRLKDTDSLNHLWRQFMDLRKDITSNADMPDYRAYIWRAKKRFDYRPADCETFHAAVEKHLVPLFAELNAHRHQQLGVDTLRPWDLSVDPLNRPRLTPYSDPAEYQAKMEHVFRQIDPVFGDYYRTMNEAGLLDLQSRVGKGHGGYSYPLLAQRNNFIFWNASGIHTDLMVLLHEGGHAFHAFESYHLPYYHQRSFTTITAETAEVASMAMELLGLPYLHEDCGGFYNDADYARAVEDQLISIVTQICSLVRGDMFQHWIYAHHDEASDAERVSAKWLELTKRFFPGVDYSGIEGEAQQQWQAILHFYLIPFYFIEYAFSQLGALQIWRNALQDQAGTIQQYRHALSLGGTVDVPSFYQAAGVRFGFDEALVQEMTQFLRDKLVEFKSL